MYTNSVTTKSTNTNRKIVIVELLLVVAAVVVNVAVSTYILLQIHVFHIQVHYYPRY